MIVVSNSTPLIALSAIRSLDLLRTLYTTIHIPEAVYHEVVVSGRDRPGAASVASTTWINRHAVADQDAVADMETRRGLDRGESETIILAQEMKANFILVDDRAARRVAKQERLPIIGTIGVLLLAKEKGLIPAVTPLLDALLHAGIYLDRTLYQEAQRLGGE